MKIYSWIIWFGTICSVLIVATAYTGKIGYDIDIHKALAGTAVIFGLLHVGLIVYQRKFRGKK